jgi:hypothetical protein
MVAAVRGEVVRVMFVTNPAATLHTVDIGPVASTADPVGFGDLVEPFIQTVTPAEHA